MDDGLERPGRCRRAQADRRAKTVVRLGRTDMPGWRLILAGRRRARSSLRCSAGKSATAAGSTVSACCPALAAFGAVAAAAVAIGYLAPAVGRAACAAELGAQSRRRDRRRFRRQPLPQSRRAAGAGGHGRADRARSDQRARTRSGSPRSTSTMFNAAALPGGHIVVFKDAITETYEPDELAGIVAHEIAHVRRRHVTEALIRELGIGALIRLVRRRYRRQCRADRGASYTREAETEADADAIAMLRRAGISPKPTARAVRPVGRRRRQRIWCGIPQQPSVDGRAGKAISGDLRPARTIPSGPGREAVGRLVQRLLPSGPRSQVGPPLRKA